MTTSASIGFWWPLRLVRLLACVTCWLACAVPHAAAQGTQPASAETLRFDILEFVVTGNTVLPQVAIERALEPFLGLAKTAADVDAARKSLEQAYQDAGYLSVTVAVPQQRVLQGGGEVMLEVAEAPIERLRITGARYFLPSVVAAQVPSLAQGRVPNFNELQIELGDVARQTSDREITPVIAAGEQPGTLAVELKIKDTLPVHGFVELNGKQSLNTEPGRLEAALSYDNLFQRRHSLGAYWYYAPQRPSDANILSLSYRLPFGDAADPGDQLSFAYTRSASDIPTSLGGATVTRGSTYSLRWRDDLRPAGRFSHTLNWSATWRDLRDRNVSVAGFEVPAAPLRYPVFGVGWELLRQGDAPERRTGLQGGINFGFAAFGARDVQCDGRTVDQFACKRSGAKPTFQVVNVGASHREPLGAGWVGSLRAQGQFSSGPLVPAEQISAGGADSVRGYYEGEQSGDFGIVLRGELESRGWAVSESLRLLALLFVDRAYLLRKEPLPGEIGRQQLGSYGIGLRLNSGDGLQARLDWARLVFDTLKADAGGGQQPASGSRAGRDSRWELSVRQSF